MSAESERIGLQQFAWDQFQANETEVKILIFEEDEFNPDTVEEFVLMSIINGDSALASLGSPGSRLFRHQGIVQFDIYTLPDTGTGKQRRVAERVRKMFRDKQMTLKDNDVLTFQEASTRPGGRERGKVRYIVSVPFTRDEVA